jgi:hypothetical protein
MIRERQLMSYFEERTLPLEVVTAKVDWLDSEDTRALLYFLQGMAIIKGGITGVAAALRSAYPEECTALEAYRDFTEDLVRIAAAPEVFVADEPVAAKEFPCGKQEYAKRMGMESYQVTDWTPSVLPLLYRWLRQHQRTAADHLAKTAIRDAVWEQLDVCRQTNRMIVLEGREGIGKTEAVKAWWLANLDKVRYISVSGLANRTIVLKAVAEAIGLCGGNVRHAPDKQHRIERALKKSGLMLIVDEAHFLASVGETGRKKPRLIDWIDTGLCNNGIPVTLVGTHQFSKQLSTAGRDAGYNLGQFKRRCFRFVSLPDDVSKTDLKKVARKLAPGLSPAGIQALVGYAASNHQPLSVMLYAIEEARLLAQQAQRVEFDDADLIEAIEQYRLPSDRSLAEISETKPTARRRKKRATPADPPAEDSVARTAPQSSTQEDTLPNSRLTNRGKEPDLLVTR